jgi:NADH-quinone oxidoreductase subunit L
MSLSIAAYITLLAPLVGALVIALAGMRLSARSAGWVGSIAILVSFVGALLAVPHSDDAASSLISPFTWFSAGDFVVGFDLYVDRLANFMMLVVSGVSFLIHVYSIGYMAGDSQFRRFFAYLNIFVFSMLMLVMAGNLVFLLVGWGLVGMASYLLIGFWHQRTTAVAASKKAFIVNALGDVFIMLGIFSIFANTGDIRFPVEQIDGWGTTLAAILLLGGAAAKSAQVPMHTWLPDAMEGPTPVSALIHAATMVTAGVYLIGRMMPIFTQEALAVVAVMGALTLTIAGFIALAQTDIKRVIAYSTMSQIGYMFVAVGVGATSVAMFHLMTHAFFKALLFMGAGIVIHALADEQDIRKMGGLRRHMPNTYRLFLVASLALCGIIPFSGFFSKDEILFMAFEHDWTTGAYSSVVWDVMGKGVWALCVAGALVTGIYTFRLLFTVFHGPESELVQQYAAGELAHHGSEPEVGAAHAHGAPSHEAPATMFRPVVVLGVLAAVSGLLVIPGLWNVVGDFLKPAEAHAATGAHHKEHSAALAWLLALVVSLPAGLLGIFIASRIWLDGRWASLRTRFPGAERVFQRAFGFDGLYDATLARPAQGVAASAVAVEQQFTEPLVEDTGRFVMGIGRALGSLQSGLVRLYAAGTAVAVLAVVVIAIVVEA